MNLAPTAASNFWDLYFRNAFLTLERRDGGYRGEVQEGPGRPRPPGGLLREPGRVPVMISFDALRAYDYDGDGRFARIDRRGLDVGAAYQAVVDQTYPYRDPAPFGRAR